MGATASKSKAFKGDIVLCRQCQAIFTGKLKARTRGDAQPEPHHVKTTFIKAFGKTSCHICSRLYEQFLGDSAWAVIPDLGDKDAAIDRIVYDSASASDESAPGCQYLAPGCLEISYVTSEMVAFLRSAGGLNYRPDRAVFRKVRAVPASIMEPLTSMPAMSVDTVSEATIDLIRTWLQDCERDHSNCRQTRSDGFVPTRLLDLIPRATSSSEVRLVLPKRGVAMRYLTLSHRWGNSIILPKLKTDTLAQSQRGIPVSHLPKTFLEAIHLTRQLGERYLWIDSLCIIQDSAPDWESEAAKMADVYGNSFLNLAATSAYDSNGGLSFKRTDATPRIGTIQSSWTNRPNDAYYILDKGFWEFDWTEVPLNTRGWVLQESILSPRVVHFHKHQIFWECNELTASETFPRGYPPPDVLGMQISRISLSADMDLMAAWKELVHKYSLTELTFDKDKLIAISGLAERISRIRNDEYLAGLWRRDFLGQLLWQVDYARQNNGSNSTPCNQDSTPSWSWASTNGRISFHRAASESAYIDDVELVEASVQLPIGGYPFGTVLGGYVRLQGSVFRSPPAELLAFTEGVRGRGGDIGVIMPDLSLGSPQTLALAQQGMKPDTPGGDTGIEEALRPGLKFLPIRSKRLVSTPQSRRFSGSTTEDQVSDTRPSEDSNRSGDSDEDSDRSTESEDSDRFSPGIAGLVLLPETISSLLGKEHQDYYRRFGLFHSNHQKVLDFFADAGNRDQASGVHEAEDGSQNIVIV